MTELDLALGDIPPQLHLALVYFNCRRLNEALAIVLCILISWNMGYSEHIRRYYRACHNINRQIFKQVYILAAWGY